MQSVQRVHSGCAPYLRLCVVLCLAATTGCSHRAAPEPAPAPVANDTTPSGMIQSTTPRPGDVRVYRGSYTQGFEASWFVPCEAPMDDALWWVTLTEEARQQRDSLLRKVTRPPTGALAVRWRGSTSMRMPAGHMGRGTRYLLVTEVLELRPLPSEGACLPSSRAS